MRSLALVLGVVAAGSVAAQTEMKPAPTRAVTVSRAVALPDAVAAIAKPTAALVAVDPALSGATVRAEMQSLPLEQGLTSIAAVSGAKWTKVFLTDAQIPRAPDGRVDAVRLVPTVRALARVAAQAPITTMGIVGPDGTLTVVSRAPVGDPKMQDWAKPRKTVYVLYLPPAADIAAAADPMKHYLATAVTGMQDLKNMSVEQRQTTIRASLETLFQTDPQMFEDMMGAGTKFFMSLPPDVQRHLVETQVNAANGQPR